MAEEVYRIEIPVTVEDRSDPSLSNVEKKVSKFDKTADRTRKRLEQMNRTRWRLVLEALDRASTIIHSVGSLARRVANGSYRLTIRVLDMATRPFRAILNGMNSALGILGIGAGTAGTVVLPLKMVIQQQNIETAFEVLLGSAEAAKQRVEELTTFAGQTPFSRDDIYEASRVLQVFTGNALSTGEGLRLVGDIAAGTQKDFNSVALWVGRLYDAMASGQPVGAMASALQEMGALSGEARLRLEKLAESGGDISRKWPLVTQEFAQFDGMMSKLSDNLANLLLGVKSFFNNTFVKRWGQGLTSTLTPLLQSFRQWRSENKELIASMGDQVERVAARFTQYFVDKIQIISRNLRGLLSDEEFKNADLFGKIKIAWDKIISEPFAAWWAGGGKERVDSIAASIGGALGAGLHSILMGLLGMASDSEAIVSDSPFIEAGASAGRSFLQAFLEAFDAGEIAKKAREAFFNLQPTWLGGETSSPVGQTLALMMDAWLIAKVTRLLKGPFKAGRTVTKWLRGGSAAEAATTAAATTTATTRTTATAAETTRRVPWYRRFFGSGAATAANPPVATTADMPSRTPWYRRWIGGHQRSVGPTAQLPEHYRPAGKQFWDNIPLDQTYSRDEVVRMANSGQLGRYNELEKAFGGPKPSWWKQLIGGGRNPLGFLSRTIGKVAIPLSLGLDVANIAAASPGEERNQVIGGTIGGWGGFAAGAAGGAAIGSIIPGIGTGIGALIGGIFGGLGGGAIGDWIGSKWEDISSWFTTSLWPSVTDGAARAWESVKQGASSTWTWISETAPQSIAKGIGYAVGYIGETLFNGDWWIEKWNAVQAWTNESWESTKETWNSIIGAIGDTVFNGEWWAEQWDAVKNWTSDSWESTKEIWNSVKDAIGSTLFNGDWWQSQWDAVKGWAMNAWESIKSGWGKFWDRVGSAFQEGKEAGQQAASGARAYARGGFITTPHLGLVGEAGPEAIIPLSSGMRSRGFELWQQVGEMLGVHPYAQGGIIGVPQMTISAPSMPVMGSTSQTIHLGGLNLGGIHITLNVDGASKEEILDTIRQHSEEIANEVAEIFGRELEEYTQNTV